MNDDSTNAWFISQDRHPLPIELHELTLDRVAAVVSSTDAYLTAERRIFLEEIGGQRVGGLRRGGYSQRFAR